MSLATMKRKTRALKGNVSSRGFSISNVNRPEPKCVYNCSVVKKMYNHTQSEYLNEKKLNEKKMLTQFPSTEDTATCKYSTRNIGGRMIKVGTIDKKVTNESGEYTETTLKNNKCLPTPDCLKPFPFAISKTCGCAESYETPQDAIDAGILPANWGNC